MRAEAWRGLRYSSVRKPKLRAAALVVPPPIPAVTAPPELTQGFEPEIDEAEPEEVGLRVLAALESMPSLEPDYCGDLTAEASVTIIERADAGAPEREPRYAEDHASLRARLDDMGEAPDVLPDEYAAYQGPIEEAAVEIFERPANGQNAASAPGASEPSDLSVRHRFFKALAGGGR